MKKIITTVGTSLFSNFQQDEVRNKYGRDYASISIDVALKSINRQKAKDIYTSAFKHSIRSIKENIEDYWFSDKYQDNKKASAEIASILEIVKEEPNEKFEVHLIATDTLQSVLAAEMIRDWFAQHKQLATRVTEVLFQRTQPNFNLQKESDYVVKDLRIDNQIDYEKGILNLLELLNKVTNKETILNITGGYKSIVPIVTVWAQISKIKIKYLFDESELEESNNPITLDNLPISFDYALFEDNYIAFESIKPSKQKHNLPSVQSFIDDMSDHNIYNMLKDSFIIEENKEKVDLTPLGTILYLKYEDSLEEDGFNMSNLVGKVMEIKVFEYFKSKFPESTVILGQPIGKSSKGDSYDLDVCVKDEQFFYGIEVKPEGASILISDDMNVKKKKTTIEYKCKQGAFKYAFEESKGKNLKLFLLMYHHKEPNKYQKSNLIKLKQMNDNPCKDFLEWIWVKPKENYKGNVNWQIELKHIKQFNFLTRQWEAYG